MNDHQWMKDNLETFQASKVYLKPSEQYPQIKAEPQKANAANMVGMDD